MSSRRLEDRIVEELDARGPIGRAALAEIIGEDRDKISSALFGLKQAGIVIPVGDGRWTSCTGMKVPPRPAPLPEGEGTVTVERLQGVYDAAQAEVSEPLCQTDPTPNPEDDLIDCEGEDQPPRGIAPSFGPDQRGPVFDMARVDVERLHGELFNATSAVRTALDLWVASDPVAYRLRTAARALAYASRLLSELEA